jgi:hypothetical protein
MTVLTDFFVASPQRATTLADEAYGATDLPAAFMMRVDSVKLAKLYSVITGDGVRRSDLDRPFDVDRPQGPWITVLHDDLVAAIGRLADDRIAAIAQAWAATEEWRRDGGDAASLAKVIRDLRRLASEVPGTEQRMYLRVSV